VQQVIPPIRAKIAVNPGHILEVMEYWSNGIKFNTAALWYSIAAIYV